MHIIQKLCYSAIATFREAEVYIKMGRVKVNGEVLPIEKHMMKFPVRL